MKEPEHDWYQNLGCNFDLLPPYKDRGELGEFLLIFIEHVQGTHLRIKTTGITPAVLHL